MASNAMVMLVTFVLFTTATAMVSREDSMFIAKQRKQVLAEVSAQQTESDSFWPSEWPECPAMVNGYWGAELLEPFVGNVCFPCRMMCRANTHCVLGSNATCQRQL